MELPVNIFYICIAIYAIGCIAVAVEAGRRTQDILEGRPRVINHHYRPGTSCL